MGKGGKKNKNLPQQQSKEGNMEDNNHNDDGNETMKEDDTANTTTTQESSLDTTAATIGGQQQDILEAQVPEHSFIKLEDSSKIENPATNEPIDIIDHSQMNKSEYKQWETEAGEIPSKEEINEYEEKVNVKHRRASLDGVVEDKPKVEETHREQEVAPVENVRATHDKEKVVEKPQEPVPKPQERLSQGVKEDVEREKEVEPVAPVESVQTEHKDSTTQNAGIQITPEVPDKTEPKVDKTPVVEPKPEVQVPVVPVKETKPEVQAPVVPVKDTKPESQIPVQQPKNETINRPQVKPHREEIIEEKVPVNTSKQHEPVEKPKLPVQETEKPQKPLRENKKGDDSNLGVIIGLGLVLLGGVVFLRVKKII